MVVKKVFSVRALTALVAAGCSDDDLDVVGTPNGCASLSGTYTATSFTATSISNATVSQNLLANGGSFRLVFNNNTFTSTFIPTTAGQSMTQSGSVTVNGDASIITLGTSALFAGGASGNQSFSCVLNGNTLLLRNSNTLFNFGQTGTNSPASISITLVKS
jgi:hypothetical protein